MENLEDFLVKEPVWGTEKEKGASGPTASKKSKNDAKEDIDEEDEAYWEAMEKAASFEGGARHDGEDDDEDEESDESSDSESGDDGEIKLSEMVTHKSEDVTFEFNDMKEVFAEGICTLLSGGKFLKNGTKAYSIAEIIAGQSIVGTTVVCEGAEGRAGLREERRGAG